MVKKKTMRDDLLNFKLAAPEGYALLGATVEFKLKTSLIALPFYNWAALEQE